MKNSLIVSTNNDDDFVNLHGMVTDIIRQLTSMGLTNGQVVAWTIAGEGGETKDQLQAELESIERRAFEHAKAEGLAAIHHGDGEPEVIEDDDDVIRDLPELIPAGMN